MITIAFSNQKGGVGKTTGTINLTAALYRAGKRVLIGDLDPQGSATEYFISPMLPADLSQTMTNLLLDGAVISPIVLRQDGAIQLLPSNNKLKRVERELPDYKNHERTLKRMLKHYQADFDYCVLDCPPTTGELTTNALAAADWVIVPVETKLMGERTVKMILDEITEARESELNAQLKVWRILPTQYDARTLHHREILAALRDKHGEIIYQDAVTLKVDISELDPTQGDYWDKMAAHLIAETTILVEVR